MSDRDPNFETEFNRSMKTWKVLFAITLSFVALVEGAKILFKPFEGIWGGAGNDDLTMIFIMLFIVGMVILFTLKKKGANLKSRHGGINDRKMALSSLFISSFFTSLICHAIGLLGFILFLNSGNRFQFYVFFVISLKYFWMYQPKESHWEERLKENEGEQTA